MAWAESKSQTLNQLSPPGALWRNILSIAVSSHEDACLMGWCCSQALPTPHVPPYLRECYLRQRVALGWGSGVSTILIQDLVT